MRYLALCTDYDGTIARHGVVDEPTIDALARLRESGRRLIMVTGRELPELMTVFPRLDLFNLVVAENGALLYDPQTKEETPLCEPPLPAFVAALKARNVARLSVGRTIVATWEPHEQDALEVIRDLGLELQVIFNKGAVMILPSGINKATGLKAALTHLNLSAHNAVGVGDAENDHAFLGICECAVAVANALPSLQDKADFVTQATHGPGVTQLIEEMLEDDLASRESSLRRHRVLLGHTPEGEPVHFSPYRMNALIVGKEAKAANGIVERLCEHQYTFCRIDPEGEHDSVASAVVLGSAEHPPDLDECEQLLCKPDQNAVIDLSAVALDDRPEFFLTLYARLKKLREQTGRPHALIVDEAHRVLPKEVRGQLDGVLLVTVTPNQLPQSLLHAVDTILEYAEHEPSNDRKQAAS